MDVFASLIFINKGEIMHDYKEMSEEKKEK